jgi:hypothetical protein
MVIRIDDFFLNYLKVQSIFTEKERREKGRERERDAGEGREGREGREWI